MRRQEARQRKKKIIIIRQIILGHRASARTCKFLNRNQNKPDPIVVLGGKDEAALGRVFSHVPSPPPDVMVGGGRSPGRAGWKIAFAVTTPRGFNKFRIRPLLPGSGGAPGVPPAPSDPSLTHPPPPTAGREPIRPWGVGSPPWVPPPRLPPPAWVCRGGLNPFSCPQCYHSGGSP